MKIKAMKPVKRVCKLQTSNFGVEREKWKNKNKSEIKCNIVYKKALGYTIKIK